MEMGKSACKCDTAMIDEISHPLEICKGTQMDTNVVADLTLDKKVARGGYHLPCELICFPSACCHDDVFARRERL